MRHFPGHSSVTKGIGLGRGIGGSALRTGPWRMRGVGRPAALRGVEWVGTGLESNHGRLWRSPLPGELLELFRYIPLSSPRTSRSMGTRKTSQMRSRVRTVMGRPASICCQCRAEKPNEIMSSWL